jgi:hypothetical protein
MRINYISAVLTLLATIACRTTQLTTTERQTIINNVGETLNNYDAEIKKDGPTAEFKYLDSSADFFWVPPGYTTAISYDSVVSILKLSAPLNKSVINSWNKLQINPLTKELVIYTGTIHSTITEQSGRVSNYDLIETGI